MLINGTTVGGLSSIDYDIAEDDYYLICDDRSDINPARLYTAKIIIQQNGIDTVQLLRVDTLLQRNGQPCPGKRQDSLQVPDPEAFRYQPGQWFIRLEQRGRTYCAKRQGNLNQFFFQRHDDGRKVDGYLFPACYPAH